jgi:hypothetical protein
VSVEDDSTGGDRNADDDSDAGRPCPACGRPMFRRHCKYVCPAHGVVFDCADTFYYRSG